MRVAMCCVVFRLHLGELGAWWLMKLKLELKLQTKMHNVHPEHEHATNNAQRESAFAVYCALYRHHLAPCTLLDKQDTRR
jgi:hypothetical protein